jgi:hypothetical protein
VAADAHVAGLMTGKAGIVHLHVGSGSRGLELVRQALAQSELPARVFNPTHVNRRKALRVTGMDVGRPSALAEALKELLRLPRKGRLAPSSDADLLVLEGEGRIEDVMARGQWHVREGRPVIRGAFEQIERS